jgi:hypothetical protein
MHWQSSRAVCSRTFIVPRHPMRQTRPAHTGYPLDLPFHSSFQPRFLDPTCAFPRARSLSPKHPLLCVRPCRTSFSRLSTQVRYGTLSRMSHAPNCPRFRIQHWRSCTSRSQLSCPPRKPKKIRSPFVPYAVSCLFFTPSCSIRRSGIGVTQPAARGSQARSSFRAHRNSPAQRGNGHGR